LQVTLKLVWALQNIPSLREAVSNEDVAFGGVDCWLLYKLTGKIIFFIHTHTHTHFTFRFIIISYNSHNNVKYNIFFS